VLTITKLVSAEYLISSVAEGVEDYFMGAGEAPGVWHGAWTADLGLEGVVEAEQLRALIEGRDAHGGTELLAGQRRRKVNAFDVTLSCPKSVSLLWALSSQDVPLRGASAGGSRCNQGRGDVALRRAGSGTSRSGMG
jgi:conjugative relaxase-like TrwC/TraI family protein